MRDKLIVFWLVAILSGCASGVVKADGRNGVPLSASVPTAGDEEMAGILAEICARDQVPAMAAALVTGEGARRLAVAGVRKWGTDVPVTLDDRWHLGSDTKIMTSVLAARLVEEGKLRWTTTVSEALPELAPSFHPAFRNVTLRQLLSHRSGLPADLDYGALRELGSVREQRLGAVRKGLSRKPVTAPGSAFLYSNLGYVVAGAMMERASGADWERAIDERVFSPLGMESAGFGGLGTASLIDQPWGHPKRRKPASTNGPGADNLPVLGPAGTVHCTIRDWAAFIADQLRGARGEAALLRPESYRELQTSHYGDDYALGWGVVEREWAGGKALTHTGSNTLYLAVAWLAPKRDFAVLVCTNEGEDSFKAADEAAGRIIERFGRDIESATRRPSDESTTLQRAVEGVGSARYRLCGGSCPDTHSLNPIPCLLPLRNAANCGGRTPRANRSETRTLRILHRLKARTFFTRTVALTTSERPRIVSGHERTQRNRSGANARPTHRPTGISIGRGGSRVAFEGARGPREDPGRKHRRPGNRARPRQAAEIRHGHG